MRTVTRTIIPVALVALLGACQGEPKESEAYKQLLADHEQTLQDLAQKDSEMSMVLNTIARVSDNLEAIRAREAKVSGPDPGAEVGDMEEHMMADIQSIDKMLAENKALIAKLRKEAKGSAEKTAELEKVIASMEQQVTTKDGEIATLKQRLASSNTALRHWITLYSDKDKQAALQQAELNTAYYVVGRSKELREKGVLTKEGGVAGLGATDKMKSEGLNKESFTRIDLSATTEIPVNGKKIRLATPHPEGSYVIIDDGEKLVIEDDAEFWSLSKYLVVVVVK